MFFNLKYKFHTKTERNRITEELLTHSLTETGYSPSIIKTRSEHSDEYTITPKRDFSLYHNSFYPDIKISLEEDGDKSLVHIKYTLTTAVSIILIVMLSLVFVFVLFSLEACLWGVADCSIIMLTPLLIGAFGAAMSLCGLCFYAKRINNKLNNTLSLTRVEKEHKS